MRKLMFGKHPKKEDPKGRTLKLAKYTKQMPLPPESYDLLSPVIQKTKINNISKLFPMDGNDQYGDCVMAGCAHLITIWNGLIGKKSIPKQCNIVKEYFKRTDGEDTGLNMLDFLKWWKNNKVLGERIIAFAEIDPKDHINVMHAIAIFKGAYLGFNVQQDCMKDFDSIPKVTWTPGPLLNEGHCIDGIEYNKEKIGNLTWADRQYGTWAWWDYCVDECYVIIPKEAENPDFAPGFDLVGLKSDLQIVQK